MRIPSNTILNRKFLGPMMGDTYYPEVCVLKCVQVFRDFCEDVIAVNPKSDEEFLTFSHKATERLNDLQEDFDENGSEIETMAREYFADEFAIIAKSFGFGHIDVEELISPRDW